MDILDFLNEILLKFIKSIFLFNLFYTLFYMDKINDIIIFYLVFNCCKKIISF